MLKSKNLEHLDTFQTRNNLRAKKKKRRWQMVGQGEDTSKCACLPSLEDKLTLSKINQTFTWTWSLKKILEGGRSWR
jgi:hypothetical protein